MRVIGFVTTENDDNYLSEIYAEYLPAENYKLTKVNNKKDINKVDGIVIHLATSEKLSEVYEWVIASNQECSSSFVWIVYSNCTDIEKKVFLQLGVNGIFHQEASEELTLTIKNTFSRYSTQIKEEKRDVSMFELNLTNLSVFCDGREIRLTRSEYQVLAVLCERPNTAITYEELFENLWGVPGSNKVYRVSNVIFRLRQKLKDRRDLIVTVRSRGYLLNI
ncbi:winged helix-turn-helix domain-containing protein [Enterococcus sp. LJL51]|uniref:winged helix family transcriptional regulator n=1 Tax=Enterococcus sp. LJL51 TaxID=3416656 RepID=UPI003CED5625